MHFIEDDRDENRKKSHQNAKEAELEDEEETDDDKGALELGGKNPLSGEEDIEMDAGND